MINHKRDIALHIRADVAAAGLPAVGGGVACAVSGKVGDAVPDPKDLCEIDDAERDRNNDASSKDGVFNGRLPTLISHRYGAGIPACLPQTEISSLKPLTKPTPLLRSQVPL